jgi:hypothetical protein
MRATSDPVETAFDALREAVKHLERRGRVTRIAGVKPEMRRRLPDFDERQLGYRSFGVFVDAAEKRGVVRTRVDADNWTRVESIDAKTAEKDEPRRLRPDIWRAFTQWGDGWLRVWDRGTARAVRMSSAPTAAESADHSALRGSLSEQDGAVILIEPIDPALQKKWIDEFVENVGDHPLASALRGSLADEKPFRAFNAALKADDGLRMAYHRVRMTHVLAAVRDWAAEHDVDVDSLDHNAPPPAPPRGGLESSSQTASPLQRMRLALHAAIDEMPMDDLRRLSVPAGFIADALDRRSE